MNLIKGPIIPFLKDKVKRHEYLLTCEIKFDAAHRLSNYKGKCSRIHGHTYRVIITVKSLKLNNWGAVVDFGELKQMLKSHIDEKYDHKTILSIKDKKNQTISKVMDKDWIVWMNNNPTAENMARDIWNELSFFINRFKSEKFKGIELDSVTVYETTTNAATYRERS